MKINLQTYYSEKSWQLKGASHNSICSSNCLLTLDNQNRFFLLTCYHGFWSNALPNSFCCRGKNPYRVDVSGPQEVKIGWLLVGTLNIDYDFSLVELELEQPISLSKADGLHHITYQNIDADMTTQDLTSYSWQCSKVLVGKGRSQKFSFTLLQKGVVARNGDSGSLVITPSANGFYPIGWVVGNIQEGMVLLPYSRIFHFITKNIHLITHKTK